MRAWICGVAALLAALPLAAGAQSYPVRSIRWVVPYAAGGSTDTMARIMAQPLSAALKQSVVIDNRGGAGGNIGVDLVAKSPNDGYTLLFTTVTLAINETAYVKLPFNLHKDLIPIVLLGELPNAMVVPAAFPAHSVAEFVALAKQKPNQINFGSGGNGTSPHVAGELFKLLTGIEMVHVPYRGDAPALQDLLAGQIQVIFCQLPAAIAHIHSGALRPLGVTTAKRTPLLPDVPTIAETGVTGFEATSWYGIFAPTGTAPEIIERINRESNLALQQPEVRARLAEIATTPIGGTPAEFARYLDVDIERWAKVVHAAKLVIE
ncbi:MAG: tripartite tricarboxylate transporter substrate binding protein [Pseudomonadota bacterium]